MSIFDYFKNGKRAKELGLGREDLKIYDELLSKDPGFESRFSQVRKVNYKMDGYLRFEKAHMDKVRGEDKIPFFWENKRGLSLEEYEWYRENLSDRIPFEKYPYLKEVLKTGIYPKLAERYILDYSEEMSLYEFLFKELNNRYDIKRDEFDEFFQLYEPVVEQEGHGSLEHLFIYMGSSSLRQMYYEYGGKEKKAITEEELLSIEFPKRDPYPDSSDFFAELKRRYANGSSTKMSLNGIMKENEDLKSEFIRFWDHPNERLPDSILGALLEKEIIVRGAHSLEEHLIKSSTQLKELFFAMEDHFKFSGHVALIPGVIESTYMKTDDSLSYVFARTEKLLGISIETFYAEVFPERWINRSALYRLAAGLEIDRSSSQRMELIKKPIKEWQIKHGEFDPERLDYELEVVETYRRSQRIKYAKPLDYEKIRKKWDEKNFGKSDETNKEEEVKPSAVVEEKPEKFSRKKSVEITEGKSYLVDKSWEVTLPKSFEKIGGSSYLKAKEYDQGAFVTSFDVFSSMKTDFPDNRMNDMGRWQSLIMARKVWPSNLNKYVFLKNSKDISVFYIKELDNSFAAYVVANKTVYTIIIGFEARNKMTSEEKEGYVASILSSITPKGKKAEDLVLKTVDNAQYFSQVKSKISEKAEYRVLSSRVGLAKQSGYTSFLIDDNWAFDLKGSISYEIDPTYKFFGSDRKYPLKISYPLDSRDSHIGIELKTGDDLMEEGFHSPSALDLFSQDDYEDLEGYYYAKLQAEENLSADIFKYGASADYGMISFGFGSRNKRVVRIRSEGAEAANLFFQYNSEDESYLKKMDEIMVDVLKSIRRKSVEGAIEPIVEKELEQKVDKEVKKKEEKKTVAKEIEKNEAPISSSKKGDITRKEKVISDWQDIKGAYGKEDFPIFANCYFNESVVADLSKVNELIADMLRGEKLDLELGDQNGEEVIKVFYRGEHVGIVKEVGSHLDFLARHKLYGSEEDAPGKYHQYVKKLIPILDNIEGEIMTTTALHEMEKEAGLARMSFRINPIDNPQRN